MNDHERLFRARWAETDRRLDALGLVGAERYAAQGAVLRAVLAEETAVPPAASPAPSPVPPAGPDADAMRRAAAAIAAAGQLSPEGPRQSPNPGAATFAAIAGHFGFADASSAARRAEAPRIAPQAAPVRPRQAAGIDRAMTDRAWASAIAETNAEIAPATAEPDPVAQPEPAKALKKQPASIARGADRASIWSKAVADANADLAAGRLGAD